MTGSLPMDEALLVLRFGALLALATWAARPLALRLVPGGAGWIAALGLAWLVCGWVPWLLAALHVLDFQQASLAGLLALFAMRMWLGAAPRAARAGWITAGAFAGLFWLGLAQRMEKADLTGLEKFTDTGFLAAAMRATSMPPQDAWYAGETLNYYYVGQAMVGAWGNMIGARPDHVYQIAMAALFAMTGLMVWAITTRLCAPVGRWPARALGSVATVLVLYGGNFHSALYTLLRPLMPATNPAFYFPDSTRFIGFDPDVPDKAFTEFVSYAFAVGDLHAHVAALPVFGLGVMILLSALSRLRWGRLPDLWQMAGFGWALGLSASINSWDVPILGLFATLGASLWLARAPSRNRVDRLGVAAVVIASAAFVTAAPFLGQFHPFASGIQPAPARTPLWQLLVLYGHGILPAGLFIALAWRSARVRLHMALGVILATVAGLLIVPEIVIVRDIYGMDFARANTMFKLSFRAQMLLIIAALGVLALAWRAGWRWRALGAALPVLAILAYAPHIAVPPARIQTLDGLRFLGPERSLVEAARVLPLSPGESLVEASGPSFGVTARVSAMTGQPAVIGWAGHEWLWRNDPHRPNRRAEAVERFYTTDTHPARCAFVARFGVRYVILGPIEAQTYDALDIDGIRALGPSIHADSGGEIIQIDPGRCP